MPPSFAEVMEDIGWAPEREALLRGGRMLSQDLIERFALAGRPAECERRLRLLLEEVPAISQVVVVPIPTKSQRILDVIERFVAEVAGEFVTAS